MSPAITEGENVTDNFHATLIFSSDVMELEGYFPEQDKVRSRACTFRFPQKTSKLFAVCETKRGRRRRRREPADAPSGVSW